MRSRMSKGRGQAAAPGRRPRPDGGRRRPKTVSICVSQAEWQLVQEHAAREREKPSVYVRRATLVWIAVEAALPAENPGRAEEQRELHAIRCAVQELVNDLRDGRDVDVHPVLLRVRTWISRVQGGE